MGKVPIHRNATGACQNGQISNEAVDTPGALEYVDSSSGREDENEATAQQVLQSSFPNLCAEDRSIVHLPGIVSGSSAYFIPQQTLPVAVRENGTCEELFSPRIQNDHDVYFRPPSRPGAFRVGDCRCANVGEDNHLNFDDSVDEVLPHARLVNMNENDNISTASPLAIPAQIIPPLLASNLVQNNSSIRDGSINLLFTTRRSIACAVVLLTCVVSAAYFNIILLSNNNDKHEIPESNLYDTEVPFSAPHTAQPTIDTDVSLQPTPALTQTRHQLIYNLVLPIYSSSGATTVFNDTSSPQYRALRWISEEDNFRMEINKNPKRIVERYVVSVFHFSTCNDDCLSPCFFLKKNIDVCFWNDIIGGSLLGVVSCDMNRFIEEIDLSKHTRNGVNLTGTIPHELSQLKQLKSLKLENNHLQGTLPSSLGQLSRLTYIDISSNDIEGTIPENIGLNSSLAYMFFRSNKFCGIIPRNIGLNPSLTHLDLGDNELTGTIPHELSQLKLLAVLKIGGNKLTGTLPSSLSELQRLMFFDISHNRIEGTIPEGIGLLSSLSYINFGTNWLTGTTPQSFCDLDKLGVLDLNTNDHNGMCLQGTLQCLCDADGNTVLREMKVYVNIYCIDCTCCLFNNF